MKTTSKRLGIVFTFLSLIALAAFAQNNRSFVSTAGNDANNCTTGNECRSFTRAMAVTNAGGEIIAITSGGYGAFTVTKAVTVMGAPGVAASLTATSGDGIDVAAAGRVVLRGLNITVTGTGTGIYATGFGNLSIENCTVTGGDYGIYTVPNTDGFATMSDTAVRGAASDGFHLWSRAALVRCRTEGNGSIGLLAGDGFVDGVVSAVDLVSVANIVGAYAISVTAGHNVALNLDHAMIAGNSSNGVLANGTGAGGVIVRVTNTTVTDNGGIGFLQTGSALFQSLSNNLVAGNTGGNTSGMITPISGH